MAVKTDLVVVSNLTSTLMYKNTVFNTVCHEHTVPLSHTSAKYFNTQRNNTSMLRLFLHWWLFH